MNYGHITTSEAGLSLSKRFGKTVAQHGVDLYGVRLFQNSRKHGSFTVLYYLEYHTGLTYSEACFQYGKAVMHYEACEGKLDNERD